MSEGSFSTVPPAVPTWVLLGVIAVERHDRVQCQCKGCGHTIYARIHMIQWSDGNIECWGRDCYSRELGRTPLGRQMEAVYAGLNGRKLTPEEREMLRTNRERLIAAFRAEQEAAERRQEEERKTKEEKEARVAERASEEARLKGEQVESIARAAVDAPTDESEIWSEGLTCKICGIQTTDWWRPLNRAKRLCICKACAKAGHG